MEGQYIPNDRETTAYLLYIFLLLHPLASAHKIFLTWEDNRVFCEYPRLEEKDIERIVVSFNEVWDQYS